MASIGFPLLLILVAICNIIAFLMPDLALSGPIPLFPITLMSKDIWMVTLNDLLVALSILLLWLEVMRAARPAPNISPIISCRCWCLGAAATEFVMLPKFGNATFFLITLTAMVDFLAGISLRARRPRRVAAPVYAPEPAPALVSPRQRRSLRRLRPPSRSGRTTSVAEAVLTRSSGAEGREARTDRAETLNRPRSRRKSWRIRRRRLHRRICSRVVSRRLTTSPSGT